MALSPKDWRTWQNYQNGFASNYTKEFIDTLDCSDKMKARITADVCAHNAGGELPISSDTGNSNGIVDGIDYNWFTWSQ